jgi:hypothetical protein
MASSLHASLPNELRSYLFGELLKSVDDIKSGRTYSAEEVNTRSKAFLDELEAEDRECASKSAV